MAEDVTHVINNVAQKQFAVSRSEPNREIREDLVSELGIRWFSARVRNGRISERLPSKTALGRHTAEAMAFVARLRGSPTPELPGPSPTEIGEAEALVGTLQDFVHGWEDGEKIVPRPAFSGCGFLAACRGDLLLGHTLYEMKRVERGFRQPDLRQLVIYCALNAAAAQHDIRRVGLINPQRGTFFRADLEWLVRNLAGRGSAELFPDILDFVTAARVSS